MVCDGHLYAVICGLCGVRHDMPNDNKQKNI